MLKLLARSERFELPTPRFVVWCSIQLSYERAIDVAFSTSSRGVLRRHANAAVCSGSVGAWQPNGEGEGRAAPMSAINGRHAPIETDPVGSGATPSMRDPVLADRADPRQKTS